jgi:hypothetical protein
MTPVSMKLAKVGGTEKAFTFYFGIVKPVEDAAPTD